MSRPDEPLKLTVELELTVQERNELSRLLPAVGTFGDLRRARKVRDAIRYKPHEIEYFGIVYQVDKNWITWNPDKAGETRGFKFSKQLFEFVCEVLGKLDDSNTLTDSAFTLYKKFCGDVDDDGEASAIEKEELQPAPP